MGDQKDTGASPTAGFHLTRRTFVKAAAATGLLAAAGGGFKYAASLSSAKGQVVIVGGGAAGISMASRLARRLKRATITLVDPADLHFYQPGFTMVAAGIYKPEQIYRKQSDCMPTGVRWVKKSVVALDPAQKKVFVEGGGVIPYDFLVLAPGLQLNWSQIEGLSQKTLGEGNVHSIYDFAGAQKVWPALQAFVRSGGRGIFTDTHTKHKCGGAPKKICLLTEHLARKAGAREKVKLDYFSASKELYDVPYYTPRLEAIYKDRNVSVSLHVRVQGVDTSAKRVHFERVEKVKKAKADPQTGKVADVEETVTTPFAEAYDFLHLVPPQSAPDFVREAGLGWTEGKLAKEAWAMADQATLVHLKHGNVICVGDVAGIPTSKTSAAIRRQVPVAVENLIALMEGKTPPARYNGYAACPIITDYGHVLLCEFDYDKKPQTSFPFALLDTSKELWPAWLLKVHVLKPLYFNGMLPGLC